MKKSVVIVLMLAFSMALLPFASATLTCSVKTSCDAGGEVEIFGMSALTNAHAALPGSAYPHKVCCSGLAGLANTGGTAFLNLSYNTNAHAGKITGSVLSSTVARIASSGPTSCVYQAACPSQYVCLASLEKNANAHVGDCNAYPSNKICCGCADLTEVSCVDGIDNDCDGFTDCDDSECDGSITGQIKDIDGNNVFDALVKVLLGTTVLSSDATDGSGLYSETVKCGTFNVVVEHVDYATVTRTGIIVAPRSTTVLDFNGENAVAKADTCEADCTFPGSSTIHAACNGKNGCAFHDAAAAAACDNAQPGWTRDYDATQIVVCPNGAPQAKSLQQANVQCSSDICVRANTPVLYNGKLVKMVVVVARD